MLLGMKPTKHCFQCGEGTETFQIWHLGSDNWSVRQKSIYVRIDILLCKVSQELVFLQCDHVADHALKKKLIIH